MEAFPAIVMLTSDPVLAKAIPAQLAHVHGHAPVVTDAVAGLQEPITGKTAIAIVDFAAEGFDAKALDALRHANPLLAVIGISPARQPAPEGFATQPLSIAIRRPVSVPHLFRSLKLMRDRLETASSQQEITFASGLRFQPSDRSIGKDGTPIDLTDKESALLLCLYRKRADWLAREALLEEVWGYGDGVDTHTLETHLYRLRGKLKPLLGEGELILTRQGSHRLNPEML